LRTVAIIVATLQFAQCTAAAAADQFDGVYKQTAVGDCLRVGEDGGALKIADGVFYGVNASCTMSNPVNVRDMNAFLYDMECDVENDGWTARALLMSAPDGGLIMVWNGYAFRYDRCTEAELVADAVANDFTPAP
jgi:hypothetical protein